MKYNLLYNNGGNSGPYDNLKLARNMAEAQLLGDRTLLAVEIRPENSNAIGGFNSETTNTKSHYIGKASYDTKEIYFVESQNNKNKRMLAAQKRSEINRKKPVDRIKITLNLKLVNKIKRADDMPLGAFVFKTKNSKTKDQFILDEKGNFYINDSFEPLMKLDPAKLGLNIKDLH